ncbi:LLM class flavin-dependent oxidoreductase [Cupriavidus pauculus]|uniref:LLM class flavin-dependent oxidoreductase n=1 Tax=Cupriavidus pauculus TaxID=82633 RepID=UPI000781AF0F|nr:LLM class flavin-dependent oxidoreductase [Cupriavidus pauculus]KAB0595069.1 LLM class flavin-dependent oxidoreductase [Cupriavidus pauculus]MBY4733203.1 LLM class flavin-dependent oxidoreductase [Cupriavidus pauculus]UAL01813.1 LLM class flavin-dependent oxidoreductase [Cupriavidus pauculus]
MIPYSVLDLSPIAEGSQAADAMHNTLALAQHAERLGYRRFWLAEHHNMPGIASAATAVLIGYVAQGTSTIRVGSGGIMLPNHSPLVVAEQFGTLAALYPGRIDLGLGRAPGSDQATARALRRHLDHDTADSFPQDVEELRAYFDDPRPGQRVRAVPGAGLKVPLWLLGSSLFSAQLSAAMGLPFAFASHFAPGFMRQAVDLYRRTFRPSEQLDRPHVMLGLNVFAADTDSEARRLFSSLQQQFLALVRGAPGQLKPPVDDIDRLWDASEADHIRRSLACSVVGNPAAVREGIQRFVDDLRPDELMLTGQIYDHEARLHSFAIAADAMQSLQATPSV